MRNQLNLPFYTLLIVSLSLYCSGCGSSTTPSGSTKITPKNLKENISETEKKPTPEINPASDWEKYPDVPFVPVMTEVDGLEIPRMKSKTQTLKIIGELPANVGNEYAKKHPAKPVTGGEVVVRLSAEPKSLNPIVETSAVESYIAEYVRQALAWQNPETLEYEPALAKKWIGEDSVKLAADYQGKERLLVIDGKQAAAEIEISYTALTVDEKAARKEGQEIELTTTDANGKALGEVWVGVIPKKANSGEAAIHHFWSQPDGKLIVSHLPTGKYKVIAGAEIYGKATAGDDGSLSVEPLTENNPLKAELQSSNQQSLKLAKGSFVDVQRKTIFTYYLNEDAKWSDGKAFTTKDLIFAFAIIKNNYVDGDSLRSYYNDIITCDALNAQTIRLQYRQQYFKAFEFTMGLSAYTPPFHKFAEHLKKDGKELTLENLTPDEEAKSKKISVHGQAFGKFFNSDPRYNEAPLGTGPYTIKKWIKKDRVILERNPQFWGKKHRGYLDRLVFKFIDSDATALQVLKSGDIDFYFGMPPDQYYDNLAGPPEWFRGEYVKSSWFTPAFSYVGWNMLEEKFKDRRVRLALSLLFDVNQFIEQKLKGDALPVSGSQYFFGKMYDHDVKPIGYDPDVAADLLAEAGWIDTDNDGVLDKDGEKFEFDLLLPIGKPLIVDQVALIQKAYKKAGIIMNIRSQEWASFINLIKSKKYGACRLSWAAPLESDPYQIWHSSGAAPEKRGSNHVSFDNAQADQLIEMLRLTIDEEKRKRINYSFHRVLDSEQPYLFLYTPKNYGAYHKRYQGVKWYRLRPGFDLTEWYVPKNMQRKK